MDLNSSLCTVTSYVALGKSLRSVIKEEFPSWLIWRYRYGECFGRHLKMVVVMVRMEVLIRQQEEGDPLLWAGTAHDDTLAWVGLFGDV